MHNLYVLTVYVCNFWGKEIGKKAVRKMLVKLSPALLIKKLDQNNNIKEIKENFFPVKTLAEKPSSGANPIKEI